MGLFDKKGIFGGSVLNPMNIILDNRPSIIDKIDMLFTDVETEGKKKGYSRAAEEYEKIFRSIESEYRQTKKLIDSQLNMYDAKSNALIEKLKALEIQKRILENQVKEKIRAASEKYDIPISQIQGSLAAGAIITDFAMIDILGMIYRHKERKLREAEQRGYLEAKELYEAKIDKLKKDLAALKSKGTTEIKELVDMISDILDAIAGEQMKVAELKILL